VAGESWLVEQERQVWRDLVIMLRLLKRGLSSGPGPVLSGGSASTFHLVAKLLGVSILGLAGYFGYQTYYEDKGKPAPLPRPVLRPPPSPPKPTLAEFVAKQVGPLGERSSEDLRKFVETGGQWSATKPLPPKALAVPLPRIEVKPEPVTVPAAKPVAVEAPHSSVLESQIKQLEQSLSKAKSELKQEQEVREQELIKRLEDSIAAQMEALLPRLNSSLRAPGHSSTAKTLVGQMDFAKNTVDDVKNKMEEIITAYEHRIETLGLTHFELISDRLKLQKEKWRRKLEEVQLSFADELQKTAGERDEQWRQALSQELTSAESHFSEQSELDRSHVRQQTELELALKQKKEVEEITEGLRRATEERMVLLNEILDRLKEMEIVQEDHARIIEKLKQVHTLHSTVESLQRTLTQDQGTLTADLSTLESLASKDEVVAAALASLADVYPGMVERGVPTIGQLLSQFKRASEKARLAALIKAKTFWGYVNARLTYFILPSSIGAVDDGDTFSLLRAAEARLERGDLRHASILLRKLQGYPKEELDGWLEDAEIRLTLAGVLEALAEDAVALVNDITTKQSS